MQKFLFTLYGILWAGFAFAQMDNEVYVESTYVPTVSDADKISDYFTVGTLSVPAPQVQYDCTVSPTSNHVFTPMEAAQSDAADKGVPCRFVRLGGGTAGQIDLRGAYGLRLTSDDLLDFDVSLRGYSARVQDAWNPSTKLPMRYYSTRGAVSYQHYFTSLTSLQVGGDFESQAMNGQHNTLFSLNACFATIKFEDFSLGGSAGFEYFGQSYDNNAFLSTRHNRESHFTTALNAAYAIDEEQTTGLDLQADFFTYSFGAFKTSHTFDLHPYYTYRTDDLQLTLGARLDFFTGVERKFRAAPDVELRYFATETLTLFGQASGGTVANSYRHFAQLQPYWIFAPFFKGKNTMPQLSHQFDYVRSAAGLEWNVATGLFARLYGGINKSTGRAELLAGNSLAQANGWQWYGHLDLRYDYRDTFRWTLNGQYNVWDSHYGNNDDSHAEAVAWRPLLDLKTEVRVQPVSRLNLTADYLMQTFTERSNLPYHRPLTSRLGATVSYRLPVAAVENQGGLLTAYVRGDNLLNRHYDLYPCVRTPGINLIGGFSLTF